MAGDLYPGSGALGAYDGLSAGAALAASSSLRVSTVAALAVTAVLSAASAFAVGTTVTLTTPGQGLRASSSVGIGTTAALTSTARFSAASSIGFSTTVRLGDARLIASSGLQFSTQANLSTGVERLHAAQVRITLGGVEAPVRGDGQSIRDILNDAPNTCSFTIGGPTPPPLGQLLRTTLNLDAPRPLFAGALQTIEQSFEELPENPVYLCTAIDDTARANRRRPFGTWTNVSATTIAQALALFAPGFGIGHIAAGLPMVPSFICDGSESLIAAYARLATAIGGYTKIEYAEVYLFLKDTDDPPEALDALNTTLLLDTPIAVSRDNSQLLTRAFGKGHGEATLADVAAAEPIIPLADTVMFGTMPGGGGRALAGTTPDGAQSQQIAYTGVQQAGPGSLVGPGAAPSVAPSLALVSGSGLGIGVYQYAVVDVTPSGKSLPSPLAPITTQVSVLVAPPGPGLFNTGNSGGLPGNVGNLQSGKWYAYGVTFVTALGETTPQTVSTAGGSPRQCAFTALAVTQIPIGPAGVLYRNLYRTVGCASSAAAAASPLKYAVTLGDNVTQVYIDCPPDSSLTVAPPTTNTAWYTPQQVSVAGIALGASPTTGRELYRTVVNGTQLKFLTLIGNNTSTGPFLDTIADGSLGANAPTADTSGISQPSGQVNAGSIALLLASAGPFFASGGWVINGQTLIRYTGITGNTLTGIPATGSGSILTTIPYGSQVSPAPALTGVTGLLLPMLAGTPVSIFVQRDDLAAQAIQAANDLANGVVPADGVYEGPPIVDERRGEASLSALCDANLLRYSTPILTFTYATRDVRTKAGKTVHIDLPGYPVGDYVIQEVTITEMNASPGTAPRFSVSASTVRFSLDDLLRKLLTQAAA